MSDFSFLFSQDNLGLSESNFNVAFLNASKTQANRHRQLKANVPAVVLTVVKVVAKRVTTAQKVIAQTVATILRNHVQSRSRLVASCLQL